MLKGITDELTPDENRLLLKVADSMRKLRVNRE